MALHSNHNGRRIAQLFRQARGIREDRACDLDTIREEDGIELVVSAVDNPGYTACLVRPGPDLPCGIILAPGQSRGRERFSVAHELGHYFIPTHRDRPTGFCGEADMVARAATGKHYEWEANEFAAELLMPRRLFAADSRGRDPALGNIMALAEPAMYDVSVTAAAIRFVEVTSESCALVCARSGVIEWVIKSDAFRYRIPWRQDALPAESHARFVQMEGHNALTPEVVAPYTWLEGDQQEELELFESAMAIPSQDQVLSLLWVVEGGSDQ